MQYLIEAKANTYNFDELLEVVLNFRAKMH